MDTSVYSRMYWVRSPLSLLLQVAPASMHRGVPGHLGVGRIDVFRHAAIEAVRASKSSRGGCCGKSFHILMGHVTTPCPTCIMILALVQTYSGTM